MEKPEQKQRVIAYIDGFNLFYSSLKGTKYKWLDLWSMCSAFLRADQELITVKYFSALVGSFANDSDMAYTVQISTKECKKQVGLYITRKAISFKVLRKNITYIRSITPKILASHQFPNEIKTKSGRVIKKPNDWN